MNPGLFRYNRTDPKACPVIFVPYRLGDIEMNFDFL
jgi:hypothetical protein